MALTAQQIEKRDGKLTASRVGVLMRGNAEEIYDLWRECIGDPSYSPPDFSDNWPVQLGSHTESLHLDWYAKFHGEVGRRGEVIIHPKHAWVAATLDGWDNERSIPIECKHVIQYKDFDETRAWYMPQLHWQMIATETKQIALSVIIGALEPKIDIIEYDEMYAAELWTRAEKFWQCVESLTPPMVLAEVAAPIPKEQWRTVDMTGNNAWTVLANDWLSNEDGAKKFKTAAEEIKKLIKPDVGLATGCGIVVKKSKDGKLSIKGEKK